MSGLRSLGDLSTGFLLSRQTLALKTEVQRRAGELSSGQASDLSAHLRGDWGALAAIARSQERTGADRLALAEAQAFAAAAEAALGVVAGQTEALAGNLLSLPLGPDAAALSRAGMLARESLEAVVAALNERTADRAVFAGDATDAAALAPAATMLADLEAAVAGATTAAGVVAAVEAWFDTPGAGFDLLGYTGSATPLAPFRLGAGETAAFPVTAADPALRGALEGFALAALLDGPTLAGAADERAALARAAAERTFAGGGAVTDLRAGLGATQARIEAASTRLETETASLELARAELVGVDPYDAATRLDSARTQLETLFALTARISRLSLVDFLR
jgi:flagellar hook-associated protein 3 FlgL